MVYSFSNLSDVSWGTKGSDKADALPTVEFCEKSGSAGGGFDQIFRTAQDLEATFQKTVQKALLPLERSNVRDAPTEEDGNKTFRTRVVLIWLLR